MAPVMLLPVAPVLLQLSLFTSPLAPSAALSRAGHCVALAKRGSKRTGGGGERDDRASLSDARRAKRGIR